MEVAPLVGAIIVALIGLTGVYLEIRTQRKQAIGNHRIDWIADFRKAATSYLASMSMYYNTGDNDAEQRNELRSTARSSEAAVRLLINPEAQDLEWLDWAPCCDPSKDSDKNRSRSSSCEDCSVCASRCVWKENQVKDLALDERAKRAEECLSRCMHALTSAVKLKFIDDSDNGNNSVSGCIAPEEFSACYNGICEMSRIIIKKEWEKAQLDIRGKKKIKANLTTS